MFKKKYEHKIGRYLLNTRETKNLKVAKILYQVLYLKDIHNN